MIPFFFRPRSVAFLTDCVDQFGGPAPLYGQERRSNGV
jgi:hypothetical protein